MKHPICSWEASAKVLRTVRWHRLTLALYFPGNVLCG